MPVPGFFDEVPDQRPELLLMFLHPLEYPLVVTGLGDDLAEMTAAIAGTPLAMNAKIEQCGQLLARGRQRMQVSFQVAEPGLVRPVQVGQ